MPTAGANEAGANEAGANEAGANEAGANEAGANDAAAAGAGATTGSPGLLAWSAGMRVGSNRSSAVKERRASRSATITLMRMASVAPCTPMPTATSPTVSRHRLKPSTIRLRPSA